jgi:hypothetical protein
MSIPFQDLREEAPPGLVAYLRFVQEDGGRGLRAALFVVNSRGEPVDFSFARIDVHTSFLWRPGDSHRQAVATLARTLFTAATSVPDLLIALAAEVPPAVFMEDLRVSVPLCRVAEPAALAYGPAESMEVLPGAQHVFWAGVAPETESRARRLLESLVSMQGLTEPFERAQRGLIEAFATT